MISFHEIKVGLERMAVMSADSSKLDIVLAQVMQLAEKISCLDEDLTLQRDKMTAKMRSVEILGEILKTQLYQSAHDDGSSGVSGKDGAVTEDITTAPLGIKMGDQTKPCDSGSVMDEGRDGYLSSNIDRSSLIL